MLKNPVTIFVLTVVLILFIIGGIVVPEIAIQQTRKSNEEASARFATEKNQLQEKLNEVIQATLRQNNVQIEDNTDFSMLLCNYKIVYLGRASGQNQYALANAGLDEDTSTSICPREIDALTEYYSKEAYIVDGSYYSRKTVDENFEKSPATYVDVFRPDTYLLRYLANPQIETYSQSDDTITVTTSGKSDSETTRMTFKYSEVIGGKITQFSYKTAYNNGTDWKGTVTIMPFNTEIVLPLAQEPTDVTGFNTIKVNKLINDNKSAIRLYSGDFIINKMLFRDELTATTYIDQPVLARCAFREGKCSIAVDTLELNVKQLLQTLVSTPSAACPPPTPFGTPGITVSGPLNEVFKDKLYLNVSDESKSVALSTDYDLEVVFDPIAETVFIKESERSEKCYRGPIDRERIQKEMDSFLNYSKELIEQYGPLSNQN